MFERDSVCFSSVLDFGVPNRAQYALQNENSGLTLKVVVPVSDDISSS